MALAVQDRVRGCGRGRRQTTLSQGSLPGGLARLAAPEQVAYPLRARAFWALIAAQSTVPAPAGGRGRGGAPLQVLGVVERGRGKRVV